MKKFLVVFLSFLFVFAMTGCKKETKITDSNESDVPYVADVDDDISSESTSADKTQGNNASNESSQSNKNNTSSNKTTTTSKITIINSSNNSSSENSSSQTGGEVSSKNNTSTNRIPENLDNGVLESATSEKIDVPENIKLINTNEANEENNSEKVKATAAVYVLDGNVVNWTTENDFIYVITRGNNRLVVINSKTMMAVANVPLAGKPAEINLIGQEIYVSLPDLCRIDVFSKSNYTKTSSLNFEHEVSSFCIDGNYIYYSEHDQWCHVYKKDMNTNELKKVEHNRGYFYQPKLYLNKQDNILCIGETGYTGSSLFYYDATTLEFKSVFRKDDYGIMNHTRDIFHIGDEIFWGNYRLSDTNANQIIGRYGDANYGSVNFVSKELVSTFEGIFLTDTYECIVDYSESGFKFEYILVSESNNIFFRARSIDANIIVGINFNLQ